MKFLKCSICGNIIKSKKENITCCGKNMELIKPNTTDAATEKHIPVVETNNNIATITVGETLHPMTEEHYIAWIYVTTNLREIKYNLKPNEEPKVTLPLINNETITSIYAYCNLHSLWMHDFK